MALSIQVNTLLETSIVILSGRLSALDRLGNRLDGVLEAASLVILDLSALHYVDADGVGQLITIYESIHRRGARLVLYQPDFRFKALLKIANLTAVFEIDDAVRRRTVTRPGAGADLNLRVAGSLALRGA